MTPRNSRLHTNAVIGFGLAMGAAGGLGLILGGPLALSGTAPLKAMGLLLALAAFASPALSQHRADTLGPANAVTLSRGVLVGLLAAFIGENTLPWLILIAPLSAVALAMDGLDGFVARRLDWESEYGARLDGELDALLTMVLSILVWQTGRAGAWILLSGLLRYLFMAAALLFPWMAGQLPPRYRRKVVCVISLTSLWLCLLPWLTPPLTIAIAAIGLLILIGSFAEDVRLLWLQR